MNKDILKKAVDLADGWSMVDDTDVVRPPKLGTVGMSVYNPNTLILDALAAQLVRQVDAIGDHDVDLECDSGSVVIWDYRTDQPRIAAHIKFGDIPDRTTSTIIAIVESNVLSTGEVK